jgi:hypothetical protein
MPRPWAKGSESHYRRKVHLEKSEEGRCVGQLDAGRYATDTLTIKGLLEKDQCSSVSLPAIAKLFYSIFIK